MSSARWSVNKEWRWVESDFHRVISPGHIKTVLESIGRVLMWKQLSWSYRSHEKDSSVGGKVSYRRVRMTFPPPTDEYFEGNGSRKCLWWWSWTRRRRPITRWSSRWLTSSSSPRPHHHFLESYSLGAPTGEREVEKWVFMVGLGYMTSSSIDCRAQHKDHFLTLSLTAPPRMWH